MPLPDGEDPAALWGWLEGVRNSWKTPDQRWSQKTFARHLGFSDPNTMRGWTEGTKPNSGSIRSIAQATGVTEEDIHRVMRGDDVPYPPRPGGSPGDVTPTGGDGPEVDRLQRVERRVELLTDLVLELQREVRSRDR